MTAVNINDRVNLEGSTRIRLDNGFLKVRARLARTGIQEYYAGELGLKDRPAHSVIRVYRPPEEVFNPDSLGSFAGMPVTDDHPAGGVTADNFRQLARGWSGEKVDQDGEFCVADLIIGDKALIAKIESGKSQISNGYGCELEFSTGTTPKGETYDAIQRNIRGNHIAVVDAGRCGGDCRIQDAKTQIGDCGCGCGGDKASETKEGRVADTIKKITVDGLPIDATDQAEAVIRKLETTVDQLKTQLTAADAKATTAEAAAADAKAKLEAELATAKAQIPTGDALDKLVAQRTALLGDAKRLAPAVAFDGKSDAEIRKLAVTAKLGDAAVAGKEDAFFSHAFDLLVVQNPAPAGQGGQSQGDPIADAARYATTPSVQMSAADTAHAEMVAAQTDAWKQA